MFFVLYIAPSGNVTIACYWYHLANDTRLLVMLNTANTAASCLLM